MTDHDRIDAIQKALEGLEEAVHVIVVHTGTARERTAHSVNMAVVSSVLLSILLATLISLVVTGVNDRTPREFMFVDNTGATQLCRPIEDSREFNCIVIATQE